jgi:predicted SnoaL-like aldol condensation-catalyzing enzyme
MTSKSAMGGETLSRAAAIDLVQRFMTLLIDPARSDEVRPLVTDDYIQHNPNIASGPDAIIAFTKTKEAEKARSSMRPASDPPMFVHEGDKIVMLLPRDLPDPQDPGKTYRTYWFDMWRIEDGKLAEHWDGALKD